MWLSTAVLLLFVFVNLKSEVECTDVKLHSRMFYVSTELLPPKMDVAYLIKHYPRRTEQNAFVSTKEDLDNISLNEESNNMNVEPSGLLLHNETEDEDGGTRPSTKPNGFRVDEIPGLQSSLQRATKYSRYEDRPITFI
ncbi:hypothetical protein ILUMI_08500 [Ignelater luminosus]|uniref:Uncharacterized protein n=1 Tax=Ignelater luminosus TaxID=2038154 RepID=A0A8K0GGZ0_IGNLU|nr:hypothetical protein ILUMI_08500 [Ignelater luminosus]